MIARGGAPLRRPARAARGSAAALPLVILVLAPACGPAAAPPADLILRGARVHTVDPARPEAGAVAVRGRWIARVGGETAVMRLRGPATRVIDLPAGALVLPGFNDGHTHFLDGALGLDQVDLTGAATLAEIQARVRRYAAARPGEPWILGFGWLYSTFPDRLPHRRDLDAAEKDRPVLLYSYDGHTAWVNSAALRAAEITARTPPLPARQGEIVRDPRTGEPTGALKEGAMAAVERAVPKPSRERRLEALRRGLRHAASLGVTSVQNCSGGQDEIDLYEELRRAGQLTIRTRTASPMPDHPADLTPALLARLVAARDAHQDPYVQAGAVKFFADGVVESNTAAMLAPYANDPAARGTPHYDARQIEAMVRKVDAAGLQIYIHAIGDAAVRMALDALETAVRERPGRRRRHRLEHIETIDAADLPRPARIGVLASMQPYHAYPEPNLLEVWAANIGPARAPLAFAWKALADAGTRLVFGSDWPVVTLDPIPGIHTAVLRQDTDGRPAGGWVPEQRLRLEQAIAAYTINGAFASFEEDLKGSITEGKLADLTVLDRDLFAVPPADLHRSRVLLTVFDGRVVFERPGGQRSGVGARSRPWWMATRSAAMP
jgi:hypothetical protein